MLKRATYLVLFGFAILAAAVLSIDGVGSPSEAEVYAAYLNRTFEDRKAEDDFLIVVSERTSAIQDQVIVAPESTIEVELASDAPMASARALKALAEVGNSESVLGADLLHLVRRDLRIRIAKENELQDIFSEKGLSNAWARFRTTFPKAHALVTFSRVGFDHGANQAVFIVSYA